MKKRNKKQRQQTQARAPEVIEFAKEIQRKYQSAPEEIDITRLGSGLGFLVHETEEGTHPRKGQTVSVHYVGLLAKNGEVFDESFSNGNPFNFSLRTGQVIAGWDQGIDMLQEGDKATLFVPAEMGYGREGYPPEIPGNSELIFYVELVKVG